MRLFMLVTFILFSGKSAHSCEIRFNPPKVFVKYGGSAAASCYISQCNDIAGMGWESSFGGTGLKEGISTLNTTFDKVTDWNVDPKCFVSFLNDEQIPKKLPFTVYKMPDKVSMSKPKDPMRATSSYDLQCDIKDVAPANSLVIRWYKGNKIIHEQKSTRQDRSPFDETFTTTLKVAVEDNGEEVWCEARLKFVPEEQSPPPKRSEAHVLTVFYPPCFIKPQSEMLSICTSSKSSLNCTAIGNPTPVYSWTFTGTTQEGIQEKNETGPVLTLESQLPGVYSCTATNAVGKTTKYFHLITVQGNNIS
ncbi:PREDICTED: intercellular adhesion molecule 3 isoform X5 [Cyprinodon variegatus]|uniref:intercellular adhesion molecule 3 isoform X5 n=1 Tax=Cyprinodon variegatus TaxID=28743 RepID=UPI0007427484|nr:PREDICTED: intercellular adhesion molecule 3 isoform X5 [Cyprinodon variegatus]